MRPGAVIVVLLPFTCPLASSTPDAPVNAMTTADPLIPVVPNVNAYESLPLAIFQKTACASAVPLLRCESSCAQPSPDGAAIVPPLPAR